MVVSEMQNDSDFEWPDDGAVFFDRGTRNIAQEVTRGSDTTPGGLALDHPSLEMIKEQKRLKRLRQREDAKNLLFRFKLLREWAQLKERQGGVARAFIVELAGMPKAGKSGAIENIRHFFTHGNKALLKIIPESKNREDCRIDTPAEGVSLRTPGLLKDDKLIDFNTWAGSYAVQELLQARHDNYHQIVILDRGPWDAGCWIEYWQKNDSANSSRIGFLKNFFHNKYWMEKSDIHVVLTVDPDEGKSREEKHRLIDHGGVASKTTIMTDLKTIYDKGYNELQSAKDDLFRETVGLNTLYIDTTKLDQADVSLMIIKRIFDFLEHSIIAGFTKSFIVALEPIKPYFATKPKGAFNAFAREHEPLLEGMSTHRRRQALYEIESWFNVSVKGEAKWNRADEAIPVVSRKLKEIINGAKGTSPS